eukprot:jgi/Bigna1/73462/fgenesh1_pg.24_\
MPDSAQDDKIVDRCLDRPGAKQAREPPVGRATSLNSSAESKCVLGTSPLAHAADEGDVHSRVSATTGVNSGDACVDSDKSAKAAPGLEKDKSDEQGKQSSIKAKCQACGRVVPRCAPLGSAHRWSPTAESSCEGV